METVAAVRNRMELVRTARRNLGTGLLTRLAIVAKVAKGGKLIGIVASLLAYSLTMSWQVAVVFVAGLCFHETGHVWAMRRIGIVPRMRTSVPHVSV
jgi:fatty acid desaturase